jgi:two-component system LytT family response regulator
MKVLIIEDEVPAAEKLERYLHKFDPSIEIVGILDNAAAAVAHLKGEEKPDLIFMDIQLHDGLSFQIFQQVQVRTPVIFTTAFNEFALDAFKVNSIDYLLKPITFTALAASMQKLEAMKAALTNDEQEKRIKAVFTNPNLKTKDYKTRFMVKLGEHIRSITTDQITVLYADGRDVYLVTQQNRKFIIDYTLEALEEVLDPQQFIRPNRTFIININAIKEVLVYSNSRLKVSLTQEFDKEIIVSREKVNEFKEWFDGKAGSQ